MIDNQDKSTTICMRLILSVSSIALFAMPSVAQEENDPDQTADTSIEEVVVTASPIRDSQAAALEAKRNAANVMDVISADTIGRFPDQNLADSLGRLPGLAISRDQGQARFINFRGAPSRYTSIAFDGIVVPGAENGRIPRFDSFPATITSAVEANKAITPNLPGEAVAGFINIKTFDPFSREGFGLSLEGGLGEQNLGGGEVTKYNGRVSWSNDNFGAVFFYSNNLREQITDNRELDLQQVGDDLIVQELDFRSYVVEREDEAYGGRVEYRGSDVVERVFFSSIHSEFVDREERNQYVFINLDPTVGSTGTAPFGTRRLLEYGKYDNSTWTNTLGADFNTGDWQIEARINYTKTENNTFLPIPFGLGLPFVGGPVDVIGTYDVTDVDAPILNLTSAFTGEAITASDITIPFNLGLVVEAALDIENMQYRFNMGRDTTLFGDTRISFGAGYDTREAEGFGFVTDFSAGFPSSVTIEDFDTGELWPTDFNNSVGGTIFDNMGLLEAWEAANGGSLRVTDIPEDSEILIEEDILTAFAMADTKFENGNIVYGVRLEYTEYLSAGPAIDVEVTDSYLNILPSVHLNYNLAEDLIFRASLSTGVSRPTYNEMRASADVSPTDRIVVGGNPTLKAETTWGGDLSLEYYFAPSSILSAGAFYRSVDNVIYAANTTIDGGIYLPSAAGEEWVLTGYENGKNGHFAGVEFNFIGQAADVLPSPLDGFGVSANLTLLDSQFETLSGNTLSLPGTSDMVFNGSIFYEKYGFSARVNYQYRDDWLDTTEDDSLSEFWAEQQRLDFSVRYTLPESMTGSTGVTLFVNANNLTNETDVRYVGTRATPNQLESYGRRFLAGVRVDF